MSRKRMVLNIDVYPLLGKIETRGSPRVKGWKALIIQQLKDKIKEKASQCSLKLDFHISEDRIYRIDIDNLAQPVLNAIEKAGIYYSDSLIYNIVITKIPVLTVREHLLEKLHIELWEWE